MLAVAACCSPDGRPWEPNCSECHDPQKRLAWGCDAPSEEPVDFLTPCRFCKGQRSECVHCNGANRIPIHRCPNKLVTSRHVHAVRAVAQVEAGILPDSGGWNDQAHTFVVAYPWIAAEIQTTREEEAARQERLRAQRGR